MVISGNMKPISGSEGAVVNLYVKVREGRLTDKNIRIELTNPTLTKPGEGKFDTAVKLDVEAEGTDVSMHQSQVPGEAPRRTGMPVPLHPRGRGVREPSPRRRSRWRTAR